MRLRGPSADLVRQRCGAALLAACAAMLAGCAVLPFGKDDDEKPDAASQAAAQNAAQNTAESGEPAAYRVDVEAPGPLRTLLLAYLDLARFQNATDADSITRAELDRLIAAAPAQARALLETEGYFNAEVEARRTEADGEDAPVVRIRVEPGPRTLVDKVSIEVQGELQTAAVAGDARALEQRDVLRGGWLLGAGEPFRQTTWSSAKASSLARLRAEGYAAAAWSRTQARVDAPANRAELELEADSGPLYRLGPIRVEGLQRYREPAVVNLATFSPGTPYSEKLLLDYQDRLQRANLFEGVAVELDPEPATAKAAPVIVRVRELPLQQASFGIGYSDRTGQRITVEHTHRNIFGGRPMLGTDWSLKNKVELGRDRQAWEGDLTSHPIEGGYRRLLAANLQRQESVDALIVSSRVRAGRAIETERLDRLVFAEVLAESNRSPVLQQSSQAMSGNYHFVFRSVDSVLLPTRGVTFSAETGAGYARSTRAESGPFARLLGRYTLYRPLGGWYGSGRVQLGQVFARDAVGVPDTLQFRAGGDESVRGYSYGALGPLVNGKVTSGRVLMTGSAEVARPFSRRQPNIWGAMFLDAGNAADKWGDWRPQFGMGVGVRVRSPVGPLKVDFAYGEQVKKFRLHVSVGVTF